MNKCFGLFTLRISMALMMILGHGLPKILNYSQYSQGFPDPLGIGNETSLILAILTEVVGATFLAFGFFTRISAFALLTTMLVAILGVHLEHPWAKIELPLLYAFGFLAIFIMGSGKLSIDAWMYRKFNFSLLEKLIQP